MPLNLPRYIVARKEVTFGEHKEDDKLLLRQLRSTIAYNVLEQTDLPRYYQKLSNELSSINLKCMFKPDKTRRVLNVT